MEEPLSARVGKSRTAKACNTCRRKKVKCDGKRPICSSCTIFKLPCGFEDSRKPLNRSSRAYVEQLEQRVRRMDEQLQRLSRGETLPEQSLQGQRSPGPAVTSAPSPRFGHSESMMRASTHASPQLPSEEASPPAQQSSDQPSYVLRSQDGKMRFFGASSSFGVSYSQDANGSRAKQSSRTWDNVARRSSIQWPLTNWVPRILQDSFEKRTTQPLPPKEATLMLVDEFRTTFNNIIPLVGDTSLIRLVDRQFSWNPDDSPSSWILINVAIAFAYRERAEAATEASSDWKESLSHVKNALNVVVDIFLRNADLPAVQGLLGLALYFQGTPNAQALFMLAASAMRLAHSIGLHRNTTSGFNRSEIEERRRTFWIAFILDADISIRVGRPPVQDMEDYDTPLPVDAPYDGKGIIKTDGLSINFFRLLAQFAVVQRHIYRHLQTVAVIRQPKETALKSAMACEEALLQWKRCISDVFYPQQIFTSEPHSSRQHLLRLCLAFHLCYASLRQLPLVTSFNLRSHEGYMDVEKEITALHLRSLDSARSALALLPYLRSLGSTYKWNVLYFFATASVALASEIRIHPTHQRSNDDLIMIDDTIEFLTNVSREEPGTYVDFILSVCSDLESSARRAIHQARSDKSREPATDVGNETVDLDINLRGQAPPIDYSTNGAFNSDADLLSDSNADFLNSQWLIPSFWNWQDMFAGIPSSPGDGQREA